MDWPLIEQKLESLRRSIQRVKEKCPKSAAVLGSDCDAQDILSLNFTRAVQMCVDIWLQAVSFPLPLPWEKRLIFYVKSE